MLQSRFPRVRGWMIAGALLVTVTGGGARAAEKDDTPSVKVGGTLFSNYVYMVDPQAVVEGNEIHPNSFGVGRAYINIKGQISHRLSFRATQDIFNPSSSDSNSTVGSYVLRLKYTYGQYNLDDWLTSGSWVRFGLQQTPWVDYEEGAYRYRFQGTIFPDREGKLTSSDKGLSFRYAFAGDRGDVHVGVYNGEGYSKAEPNDQKAFQGRVSVRPFTQSNLHGLRLAVFFDGDNYSSGNARQRWIANALFEDPHLNAGFDFMGTKDQPSSSAPELTGQGFSVWATPRVGNGWEGLLRFDQFKPDKDMDAKKKTFIGGVAYWFPVQKGVTGTVLADYELRQVDGSPDQKQIAVHTQLNF